MKKITALCIAILLASAMIFTLASCKNEKPGDDEFNFSAEVKATELVIYNSDETFQTLTYPEDRLSSIDVEYAKKHIELVDLDFDGFLDVCLAVKKDGSSISYLCWLFEKGEKRFNYSNELSELTTISLNKDKKQIISSVTDESGNTQYVFYTWENGKLQKSEELKSDDNRVPSDVSEAVKNNTVGEKENTIEPPKDVKPNKNNTTAGAASTTKKPETTEKVSDTTQGAKPETTTSKVADNTTTTAGAPVEGNVQLATGDFDDGWF